MAPIANNTTEIVIKRGINILAPIQGNWDKIEPIKNGYMSFLTALSTIFAAAATVAMIIRHNGVPQNPFTKEKWNPEPADKLKDDWEGPDRLGPEMTEEEALAWDSDYDADGYKEKEEEGGDGGFRGGEHRREGWQRVWNDERLYKSLRSDGI